MQSDKFDAKDQRRTWNSFRDDKGAHNPLDDRGSEIHKPLNRRVEFATYGPHLKAYLKTRADTRRSAGRHRSTAIKSLFVDHLAASWHCRDEISNLANARFQPFTLGYGKSANNAPLLIGFVALENLPAYFASWSDEIASRANRVRQLIGAKHWLSDGMHKEFLLRDFLSRHLPSDLHITRGFIRSLEQDAVSPEVDVLISDPKKHSPIFYEGGLQIVPPSSVLATLEVKSTYRKSVASAAIENVLRVRAATRAPSAIWSGIMVISAECTITPRVLVDDVKEILEGSDVWKRVQAEHVELDWRSLVPCLISVFDQAVCFIDCDPESTVHVRLRGFNVGNLAAALALGQLLSHVRACVSTIATQADLDVLFQRFAVPDHYSINARVPTP